MHVKLGERGDFEGCEPIALWEAEGSLATLFFSRSTVCCSGADIRVPDYVYRQLESPDKLVRFLVLQDGLGLHSFGCFSHSLIILVRRFV